MSAGRDAADVAVQLLRAPQVALPAQVVGAGWKTDDRIPRTRDAPAAARPGYRITRRRDQPSRARDRAAHFEREVDAARHLTRRTCTGVPLVGRQSAATHTMLLNSSPTKRPWDGSSRRTCCMRETPPPTPSRSRRPSAGHRRDTVGDSCRSRQLQASRLDEQHRPGRRPGSTAAPAAAVRRRIVTVPSIDPPVARMKLIPRRVARCDGDWRRPIAAGDALVVVPLTPILAGENGSPEPNRCPVATRRWCTSPEKVSSTPITRSPE